MAFATGTQRFGASVLGAGSGQFVARGGAGSPAPVASLDGRFLGAGTPYPAAAADYASGTNAAAAVTLAATPYRSHLLYGLDWSYSAAPTSGLLSVTDGGTVVFAQAVTASGPGFHRWDPPKAFTRGNAVVVTLAAGGAGVEGRVSLAGRSQV